MHIFSTDPLYNTKPILEAIAQKYILEGKPCTLFSARMQCDYNNDEFDDNPNLSAIVELFNDKMYGPDLKPISDTTINPYPLGVFIMINVIKTIPQVGPAGPSGPPGASGAGTGDVLSSGGGYVDNAIIRYDGVTGTIIQNSSATISDVGLLTATNFSGGGTALTALNAAELASGIIPDARFPSTLPAVSGANLTALPAILPASSGVNITALNATQLTSGTVPVLRLGDSGIRDATTYLRGDNTWASVAGGGSDSFSTIAVAGQTSVVADSATDTLTLVAGSGITITTVAGTDTITITSTASGGASAFDDLTDAVSASLTIDRIYLPAITMLDVTANGTSAYRFDQYGTADDPTVYAINGTTIAFNLAGASGHPFLIQDGTGVNYDTGLVHVSTTGAVSTGSAAQAKTSGTLYWKIPSSISGGYRYQCQSHLSMVGTISVKNFVAL
jgi:plastocyanin